MRLRTAFLLALVSVSALVPAVAQTASSSPASSAATAVPPLIRYSGLAMDSEGRPLIGDVNITFLIYNQEERGSPLWAESQIVPLDSAGHYQVQLGAVSVNGIPLDLFANGDARWLDVQVAGQKPQPRVLMVSVPYALKSADAATLGGLPPSAFALAGTGNVAARTGPSAVLSDAVTDVTTTGGTANNLAKFSGASTVVSSILYDNGTEIGIGTSSPGATLDVRGSSDLRGATSVYNLTTATATAGSVSYGLEFLASAYDSSTAAAVKPLFEWRAEPTGNDTPTPGATLNLLSSNGIATTAETGFHFNSNGTLNFATGQTFPGTGAITGVTAGTALTGGGTAGAVTLNLDTTKVPLLAAANTFTGNQTVTGSVTATSFSGSGAALSGVTAANSAEFGGLTPAAFAELAASNTFSAAQSFTQVGIGTAKPISLLEGQATASKALGPVFTLTNTAGGLGAGSALDFNTILPSTTGTYNPMVRITAQDADHYSDNLVFQSNTPGAQNSGLQTNLIIQSNGQVGINTTAPGAQLEVDANPNLDTDAIYGFGATSLTGTGTIGVKGVGGADSGSIGVQGFGGPAVAASPAGAGGIFTGGYAEGTGSGGDGVDAYAGGSADSSASAGYAGYFGGDVTVTGTLSAGAKDFEIDHPLDPANKYLDHASVESSEMVNIYSGNVTTDELGIATVKLPEWFESVNTDFRYQLTVVGKFAQAIISQEIANHEFEISTNASFTKVSWQVTGVRHDAFATAHPLVVEREKAATERGFYAHPELYGQPAEKQIQWARHREVMRRIKTLQTQPKNTLAKPAIP